ncbi:MAG: iron ABC transporter [Hyphomicrobiales bacterium]|nr:ABC transporter substrate-binding protein [Hyphomicrobiales bacterium]PCH49873.1 MAG: iron ABC transporter [Hyphomicrobiales bacterium]
MLPFGASAETLFPALNGEGDSRFLKVYSSLDEDASKPLIAAFQKENPDVSVRYNDLQSLEIYERVIRETDEDNSTADLVFSSAMDLQVKLVNDGYAQTVRNSLSSNWPNWAQWRSAAYGLTFEPSVVVYHKPSFIGRSLPENRSDLAALLKSDETRLYGKIATYDIERSGLGFLFLARDQEHNRAIWDLVTTLGEAGVKLYSNSSAILERVADGRFLMGYNILGSYAESWVLKHPDLGIIMLKDYTVVMSRIALIPKAARNADLGKAFLAFLMSEKGQTIMAKEVKLPALNPNVTGKNTAVAMRERLGSQLRPITIGPGLIAYLDQVKRARFLSRWNAALRGN